MTAPRSRFIAPVAAALIGLLLGLAFLLPGLSAATAQYSLATQWGRTGSGDDQFLRIGGIDVDAGGNVYAVDTVSGRIQKFTAAGAFVAAWGAQGTGDGQFVGLQDVAVDFAGNIYGLDLAGNQVQRFAPDGSFVTSWEVIGATEVISHSIPFGGVATDSSGDVYVASSAHGGVLVFDGAGNRKRTMDVASGASLNIPTGVDVNADGVTYVFDTFNRRVQLYDAAGLALAPIYGADTPDTVFRSLARGDVEVDAAGKLYVADFATGRIHRFAADGTFEYSFVVRDSAGRVVLPGGIAIDAAGAIYIAGYYANVVLKFTPIG
ncbi:MAG TPA: hypothetical protein QGG37_03750 [Chloroflexota bacterium]|nr:hypothetical protein [Chloroflexota bacterium]